MLDKKKVAVIAGVGGAVAVTGVATVLTAIHKKKVKANEVEDADLFDDFDDLEDLFEDGADIDCTGNCDGCEFADVCKDSDVMDDTCTGDCSGCEFADACRNIDEIEETEDCPLDLEKEFSERGCPFDEDIYSDIDYGKEKAEDMSEAEEDVNGPDAFVKFFKDCGVSDEDFLKEVEKVHSKTAEVAEKTCVVSKKVALNILKKAVEILER